MIVCLSVHFIRFTSFLYRDFSRGECIASLQHFSTETQWPFSCKRGAIVIVIVIVVVTLVVVVVTLVVVIAAAAAAAAAANVNGTTRTSISVQHGRFT